MPSPPPLHSTASSTPGLNPSQLAQFNTNGYLPLPGHLTPAQCAALLTETQTLLSHLDLSTHPGTTFSTGDPDTGKPHVGDTYFLTSGDKIRYFFEESAFSVPADPSHPPTLLHPPAQSINKIGHALHALSPSFAAVSHQDPRIAAIARSLGFKDPRLLQSMLICKQPEIGGAVPPHQDSTFLYTDPPSAVGFWVPLVDATRENGCLAFAKGSHRRAPIRERFVRVEGGGTGFVGVEGGRFPRGLQVEEADGRQEEYTVEEMEAGTLVLIHGNVLHKSERNTSVKGRMAYTFHVIEGEGGGCEFDGRNWLQVPEDARGGSGRFTELYGES